MPPPEVKNNLALSRKFLVTPLHGVSLWGGLTETIQNYQNKHALLS